MMNDTDMYTRIVNNLDPDGDVMRTFIEAVWFDRTLHRLNFKECDEILDCMVSDTIPNERIIPMTKYR